MGGYSLFSTSDEILEAVGEPPLRDKNINILVSLALAVLYALTIPTHLPDADGPQFVVIGITGGIAHPPGYPLYCSLLRTLNLLFNDPETSFAAFAYFSAILSGAAAFTSLDMLTRIGISTIARVTTVGIIFTSFSVWHISNNVEPFALNLLLCALVFWFVASLIYDAPKFPVPGMKTITALGVLFGLGICNHHTQSLLVPMTCYAIVKTATNRKGLWVDSRFFVGGMMIGLIPLLYFFTADLDAPMVYGLNRWRDQPFVAVFRHLLRLDYGTFNLVAYKDPISRSVFLFQRLAESVMYIGVPFSCLALWHALRIRHDPKKNSHNNLQIFITCSAINILPISIFFILAKFEHNNFSDAILSRFVALPALLLCPLMAIGLELIKDKARAPISWSIATLLLCGSLTINLGSSDRRFQRLPEFTLKTMLDLSKNGFLLGDSDFMWAGIPFMKVVRRTGTDVRFIVQSHLRGKKSREAYFRKWQLPHENWKNVNDFFEYAVKNGGLAFEFPPVGNAIIKRVYPLGPIYITGKVSTPELAALFTMNKALYSELEKSNLLNKNLLTSDWELYILQFYAQPWAILADSLRDTNPDLALEAEAFRHRYTSTREQINAKNSVKEKP
jgi:hypothetical protein